ncbi:MAG: class I SAM-dependent methyltransferase [bacterium]
MKQWYEELFTDFARSYDKEMFVQGTIGEVDFIEKEIEFNKEAKILDIGCGTGRHSIELSKRGYNVLGFDLSLDQLTLAKEKAANAGVNVVFEQMDARYFNYKENFDLGIMICEGSFPLMETDEMNFSILKNAYNSIKPGGKLIFTTLNGLFPLFHSVKDFINDNEVGTDTKELTFDLMTFREKSNFTVTNDLGTEKELKSNERYYVPSEIFWLTNSIGFKKTDIYGCKLGAFSRDTILTTEDYEMLIIAEK